MGSNKLITYKILDTLRKNKQKWLGNIMPLMIPGDSRDIKRYHGEQNMSKLTLTLILDRRFPGTTWKGGTAACHAAQVDSASWKVK